MADASPPMMPALRTMFAGCAIMEAVAATTTKRLAGTAGWTPMQAAMLRVKLQHLDEWNQQRRMLACRYHGLLGKAGLVQADANTVTKAAPIAFLASLPEAYHIYHQYVVRAWRRDQLREFLTSRGIGSEIYYPVPLHLQECFAYLGYRAGDLPEAERAAKEVLALPMFPELREDEQQRVVGRNCGVLQPLEPFHVHPRLGRASLQAGVRAARQTVAELGA